MKRHLFVRLCLLSLPFATGVAFAGPDDPGEVIYGERADPSLLGPSDIAIVSELAEREKLAPQTSRKPSATGWIVPKIGQGNYPASGEKNLVNGGGDAEMGIGFPQPADLHGMFFTAQGSEDSTAGGVRVRAYRNGVLVGESEWMFNLSTTPQWMPLQFENIDRIIIEACASLVEGSAWYGIDDITYSLTGDDESEPIVVDFEDVPFKTKLSGTGVGGLIWEEGPSRPAPARAIPAPHSVEMEQGEAPPAEPVLELGAGDGFQVARQFQGISGAESFSFPPDTHGAVGPNHFVEVVNSNVAIFRKSDGVRVQSLTLGALLPGSSGDPRIVFDVNSQRWIAIATDFSTRVQLGVSATSDPTGAWFRTNIVVSSGSDASTFPDFPTLGVDANGIYIGWFPVGGAARLGLIAIDKAPLVSTPQSLGTVTFFRNLPFDRALGPAVSHGVGAYIVSTSGPTSVRIRRVNPPLSSPTLTQVGTVTVPAYGDPPDAQQLGGGTALDTGDARIYVSHYRDGFLWAAHTINGGGRAAARWYQFNPTTPSLVQSGTISNPTRAYYYPSIAVNSAGAALIGFTGSSSTEFAGAWWAARYPGDPSGQMSAPQQYRAGSSSQSHIDNVGRNRWGDYSHTSVDPSNDRDFWTIQSYAHTSNNWGTQVAVIVRVDCNNNGIPDECDINCAACGNQPGCGMELDCNNNLIPDSCEIANGAADCNGNGVPDECDIAGGNSQDCNGNGVPDECDLATLAETDCNNNGIPDSCDIANGAADCDGNGLPDTCDIANGAPDCNNNGRPDSCDLSVIYNENSGDLSPIGTGSDQSHTFTNLPNALTPVTITLTTSADVSTASEFFTLFLNGVNLGDFFIVGQDCANPPISEGTMVSAIDWNNSINANGGAATILVAASPGVNGLQCSPSFVRISVSYTGVGDAGDQNGNGIPDECEGGLPGDMNCDGVVSVSDIGPFVLAVTDPAGYLAAFPNCNINNADVNNSGDITVSDIGPFVVLLTGP
jgi:hypothetical protein